MDPNLGKPTRHHRLLAIIASTSMLLAAGLVTSVTPAAAQSNPGFPAPELEAEDVPAAEEHTETEDTDTGGTDTGVANSTSEGETVAETTSGGTVCCQVPPPGPCGCHPSGHGLIEVDKHHGCTTITVLGIRIATFCQ